MISTRLSRTCEHLIEAGWLAAAALVPAFFNVFSHRVFEPDKMTLLRTIALVMALAWLIKILETADLRGLLARSREILAANPLALAALLLGGVYLLATLTSVVPGTSFWGSYQRLQGALSFLSYLVLFFLVTTHLRTRAQWERLVGVVILTSLPIASYGIVQHLQRDPLPWGADVTQRVTSSLGNPIFLAAYLIMVVPLTLGRLFHTVQVLRAVSGASSARRWWAYGLFAFYVGALTLQLLVVLLTQSRGPWLGLGVGFSLFWLLWLLRGKRWRLFWVSGAALLGAAAFTLALNLPHSPLAPLKGVSPHLERLGSMLETETGTGRVRMLIWFGDGVGGGTLGMITADPLRLLIGYGPESMYVAFSPYYPPDLAHYEARNAVPDRSHNHLLDLLVTTGILGLSTYLLLVGLFFLYGLRALFRVGPAWLALALFSLTAGITAHLVESFFGIAVAATQTYLWLYLAAFSALVLLSGGVQGAWAPRGHGGTLEPAALPQGPLPQGQIHHAAGRRARLSSEVAGTAGALVVGLGVAALVLWHTSQIGGTPNQWLAWPAGFLAMIGARLFLARFAAPGAASVSASYARTPSSLPDSIPLPDPTRVGLYFLGGYVALSFLGLYLLLLQPLGRQFLSALDAATRPEVLVLGGTLWFLAGLALSVLWVGEPSPVALSGHIRHPWRHLALLALGAFLLLQGNLAGIIADIHFKTGQNLASSGRTAESLVAYLRALRWAPHQDFYYIFLGRSLIDLARIAPPASQGSSLSSVDELLFLEPQSLVALGRQGLFQAATLSLEEARRLSPRNVDHWANLGRLHLLWADTLPHGPERQAKLEQAAAYFRQATVLSPNAAHLRADLGAVYALLADLQRAMQEYQAALALDAEYPLTYAHLGRLFAAQELTEPARAAYERALELNPSAWDVRAALASLYAGEGKLAQALVHYSRAVQENPAEPSLRHQLALVYQRLGEPEKALREAERALALAPEPQKGALRELVAHLKGSS